MNPLNFETMKEGDDLPQMRFPPIGRLQLALYCGGSGDHNPIHVDTDFARRAGMRDVFAPGMLSMCSHGIPIRRPERPRLHTSASAR
jgi:acyl dehydratase